MDPDEGEHDVMMAFLCHNEHNLMLMLYSGQVMFEIAASRLPIRLKAGMEEEDMRELRDVLHAVAAAYKVAVLSAPVSKRADMTAMRVSDLS